MVNYNKTKIYKIWSPLGDKIYIGCTTKEYLSQRMVHHRSVSNECKSSLLFIEYGVENCYIELIEAKECNNKDEQKKLEGGYIRSMNCINKIIPGVFKKDYKSIEHKEHILSYQNEICKCECGCNYTRRHKARHQKTKKHIKLINDLNKQ